MDVQINKAREEAIEVVSKTRNYFLSRGWIGQRCGGIAIRHDSKKGVEILRIKTDTKRKILADESFVSGGLLKDAENDLCSGMWKNGFFALGLGAVAHTTSLRSILVSERFAPQASVSWSNYECLKIMPANYITPEGKFTLSIVANDGNLDQKMIEANGRGDPAILVLRHGLYVWGPDDDAVIKMCEAFETLFECTPV